MNEIVYATGTGERLISTQLASRLGITRSAVSQIVAKMEKDGALRRVPDAVDRKIAYVELTDEIAATYKVIVNEYADFVGKVVAYMGASKMERLFTLADEFSEAVALAAEDCNAKK
jgi:DNA-binding MarR family transcriptional regulator